VAERSPEHASLVVRVKPQARHAGIIGRYGRGIKVAVRAAPERGRANQELLQILAAALRVDPSQIELVRGATSQDKQVRVRGLDEPELQRRLQAALAPSRRRSGTEEE
jgi:uncharacterized protein (TIGR00251 family)